MNGKKLRDHLAYRADMIVRAAYAEGYASGFREASSEKIAVSKKDLEQEPCDDTISRQEALNCFKINNSKGDVWYALKELPPVQPISRWIPVSERLPEEDVKVLTTIKWKDGSRYVGIDSIVGGKWMLNIPEDGDTTIAWMPLPKPFEPHESERV